jgi:hypothetical protein
MMNYLKPSIAFIIVFFSAFLSNIYAATIVADTFPNNLEVYGNGLFSGSLNTSTTLIRPGQVESISPNGARRTYFGNYASAPDFGVIDVLYAPDSSILATMGSNTASISGLFETFGTFHRNTFAGGLVGQTDFGTVAAYDDQGWFKADIAANLNRAGMVRTWGANNSLNTRMSNSIVGADHGWIGVFNHTEDLVASLYSAIYGGQLFIGDTTSTTRLNGYVGTDQAAYFVAYGSDNSVNAAFGTSGSGSFNGWLGVYDANSTPQASMYIDNNGDGVIWGDIKNFRMDHPADESKEICYASLEGPEAGAYERGVGELSNGEVFIPYSAHFQSVINPETITIQLTPHSTKTFGLAVIDKRSDGFVVKELMDGLGNFSFDWEVKGKRQGYEDYRVIRDKGEGYNAIGEIMDGDSKNNRRTEDEKLTPPVDYKRK